MTRQMQIEFFIDWIASLALAMTYVRYSRDTVIARRNDEAIQEKFSMLQVIHLSR